MLKWAYSRHSKLILKSGNHIKSQAGVRQGDPLGPLLFSIAYSSVLQCLRDELIKNDCISGSEPVLAYLDDTFVVVDPDKEEKTKRINNNIFGKKEERGFILRPNKTKTSTPTSFKEKGITLLGSLMGLEQKSSR